MASPFPDPGIQITAISLRSVDFERTGFKATSDALDLHVQLGTGRPAPDSLAVDLTISTEAAGLFRISISYGALFRRADPFAAGEPQKEYWQRIAAAVAPLVLMPYIRAVFSFAVVQAGLPHVVLPLVNPQAMFTPEEVAIPDETGSESASSGG